MVGMYKYIYRYVHTVYTHTPPNMILHIEHLLCPWPRK